MIEYRTLYSYLTAERRARLNHYRWGGFNRDTDRLTTFTLKLQAQHDSALNWQWCRDQALRHGADTMIMRANCVQFLGERLDHDLENQLLPQQWIQDYQDWCQDSWMTSQAHREQTDQGQLATVRLWRPVLCVRAQQGVWDLVQHRRLTQRAEIVQRFWTRGFATLRGHVPMVCTQNWSGNAQELQQLVQMATTMSARRGRSEVARRMVSTLRSLRARIQWPGYI